MANTFKFGNGNWAVKDGFALAYNDENNNFKPLPFDFTRASSATRVNKQGLIETVPSGKPRIDFTDNTSGHLLLEPSRTNLIYKSEELDDSAWSKVNSSVTANEIVSPDGNVTADKVTTTQTTSYIRQSRSMTSGTTYTYSAFVKKGDLRYYKLWISHTFGASTSSQQINFDLDSKSTTTFSGTQWTSSSIEDYGNGWLRCIATTTSGSHMGYSQINSFSDNNNSSNYSGSAGYGYIWGVQMEVGSYPTSYIPTEGSSVTRVVDDIALSFPNVDSFNSSSGFSVIAKFDIGAAGTGTSAPFLYFNDDTSSTYIGFGSNTTNFRCRLNLSGTSYLNTQANAPRTQRNSLFVSCDSSGWSQGANGSTNHTGTNNASVFNRLASISFVTNEVYGIIKISELLVYNTRLTNTELQNLTS